MKTPRIGWSIEFDAIGESPVPLGREEIAKNIRDATDLCVNGLVRAYGLDNDVRAGINRQFSGLESRLSYGGEGGFDVPVDEDDTPAEGIKIVPDQENPQIFISFESISEEATNLLVAMKNYMARNDGGGEVVADTIGEYLDERHLLVAAATRIAAARRMLKYVVLPTGILSDKQERTLGFDSWFQGQVVQRKLAPNNRVKGMKQIRERYAEQGLALKNLRRTVWAPIFFSNLGSVQQEIIFYFIYREQLGMNNQHTVTFSNPLTELMPAEEAAQALKEIFFPPKPKLARVR